MWLKFGFDFMHLQVKIFEPSKIEFLTFTNNNTSLEYIFFWKEMHQLLFEVFYAQQSFHSIKDPIFVKKDLFSQLTFHPILPWHILFARTYLQLSLL